MGTPENVARVRYGVSPVSNDYDPPIVGTINRRLALAAALAVAVLGSGCATVAKQIGAPDFTVCHHVLFERTGGEWHALQEGCKG